MGGEWHLRPMKGYRLQTMKAHAARLALAAQRQQHLKETDRVAQLEDSLRKLAGTVCLAWQALPALLRLGQCLDWRGRGAGVL